MGERNAGSPSVMPWEGLRHFHLDAGCASEVEEIMGFLRSPDLRLVDSLPQRPMIAFAFAFVLIALLAPGGATAIAAHRASLGYEDETGFHYIEWAAAGSNSASRLLPLILGMIGSVGQFSDLAT